LPPHSPAPTLSLHAALPIWLAHEVLVERVFARDEHCQAVAPPPGAPPLLAQRGDRPGEADREDAVQQSDVDPELERVRGRDAEQDRKSTRLNSSHLGISYAG